MNLSTSSAFSFLDSFLDKLIDDSLLEYYDFHPDLSKPSFLLNKIRSKLKEEPNEIKLMDKEESNISSTFVPSLTPIISLEDKLIQSILSDSLEEYYNTHLNEIPPHKNKYDLPSPQKPSPTFRLHPRSATTSPKSPPFIPLPSNVQNRVQTYSKTLEENIVDEAIRDGINQYYSMCPQQSRNALPTIQKTEAFPSSQTEAFPSAPKKDGFPSMQSEAFPSTQKTEAFPSAPRKDGFPSMQSEEFPTSQREQAEMNNEKPNPMMKLPPMPPNRSDTPLNAARRLSRDEIKKITTDFVNQSCNETVAEYCRKHQKSVHGQSKDALTPHYAKNEVFPSSQNRESFPSSQREIFPSSQNREAFPSSQNREAFPSSQREAFPSSQREAFPSSQREAFPSSQNREAFPSSQNREAFPSTQNREAFPNASQTLSVPIEVPFVDEVIHNGLLDYYCIYPDEKPRGFGAPAETFSTASLPPLGSPFIEKRYIEKPIHEIENDLINEVIREALDEYRINNPEPK